VIQWVAASASDKKLQITCEENSGDTADTLQTVADLLKGNTISESIRE